jgi:hypothetical protein
MWEQENKLKEHEMYKFYTCTLGHKVKTQTQSCCKHQKRSSCWHKAPYTFQNDVIIMHCYPLPYPGFFFFLFFYKAAFVDKKTRKGSNLNNVKINLNFVHTIKLSALDWATRVLCWQFIFYVSLYSLWCSVQRRPHEKWSAAIYTILVCLLNRKSTGR